MKNNAIRSTAKRPERKFARYSMQSLRPVLLCLPWLLTACVKPSVQYVQVAPVPLPAEWLADCIVPPLPEPFTFGASVDYNLQLLAVVKNCNVDKANIRRAEEQRQHEFTDVAGASAVPVRK